MDRHNYTQPYKKLKKGHTMTQGNTKAQRKRRKQMLRQVQRAPNEFLLIDGNFSYYPYAYCKRKGAYLTMGLTNTHKCVQRKCEQFERIIKL